MLYAVSNFRLRMRRFELRACDKISDALRCRPSGPLARRERRAYRVVCEERATQSAGLRAAARRGAAVGGHLLCWRSSTMSSHRLRRAALHLPARRSRRSASLILSQALIREDVFFGRKGPLLQTQAGATVRLLYLCPLIQIVNNPEPVQSQPRCKNGDDFRLLRDHLR